jgi:hypothetical protein
LVLSSGHRFQIGEVVVALVLVVLFVATIGAVAWFLTRR